MGQDRFCAVWLMYSHRSPDNEKLCSKQRPSTSGHDSGIIQAMGDIFKAPEDRDLYHIFIIFPSLKLPGQELKGPSFPVTLSDISFPNSRPSLKYSHLAWISRRCVGRAWSTTLSSGELCRRCGSGSMAPTW